MSKVAPTEAGGLRASASSALVKFSCPGCGNSVETLSSSQPMHECPKKNNRLTLYKRDPQTEETAMPKTAAPPKAKASKSKSAPTSARRPSNAIAVRLPKPTPAIVESLTAALERVPAAKSIVRDGELLIAPAEVDEVALAITEHMAAIMKANRSANAYREVQLRQIRNAVREVAAARVAS